MLCWVRYHTPFKVKRMVSDRLAWKSWKNAKQVFGNLLMFQFVAWTRFLKVPCIIWSPQLPILINLEFSSFFRSLQILYRAQFLLGPFIASWVRRFRFRFLTEQFNDTTRFLAVWWTMNLESKYLVIPWFKFLFDKRIISIWQFWKLLFKL